VLEDNRSQEQEHMLDSLLEQVQKGSHSQEQEQGHNLGNLREQAQEHTLGSRQEQEHNLLLELHSIPQQVLERERELIQEQLQNGLPSKFCQIPFLYT